MDALSSHQLAFRDALAQLSAAVSIITTDGLAGRCGITATAVCSVTDAPPTVLICINRSSSSHEVFRANGLVAVNVLCGEQQELARHFAGMTKLPMPDRFQLSSWHTGENGVPLFRDALLRLQGRIVDSKEVGTHSIFFVELTAVENRGDGDGLIYFNREFHRVERQPAAI